jgi:two-component system chemotaxis response regulator CheY
MRFLVVDDDPVSRKLLSSLLCKYGACDTASNGSEAVKRFAHAIEEGEPYAAVCVDINMPGISGHTVIRRLREIEAVKRVAEQAAARLIMTTASSNREDVLSAANASDAYLLKPLHADRLHACLAKFGLIPAAETPPADAEARRCEEVCQRLLEWCDRDSIRVGMLANMIVRMAASITRQSEGSTTG